MHSLVNTELITVALSSLFGSAHNYGSRGRGFESQLRFVSVCCCFVVVVVVVFSLSLSLFFFFFFRLFVFVLQVLMKIVQ